MPTLYALEKTDHGDREEKPDRNSYAAFATILIKSVCFQRSKEKVYFLFFDPVPLHSKIQAGSPLYVSPLSVGCTPEQTLNPPDIPPGMQDWARA